MKNLILLGFLILGISSVSNAFETKENTQGQQFSASVYTWTGTISEVWDLAGNWSPASVPLSTDDIIIPVGTINHPAHLRDKVIICRNATIQPCTDKSIIATGLGFTFSGGETVIDGNLTINANATLVISSACALTINGNLTIIPGGNMIIESGGSLITNGDVSGTASIKREISVWSRWHFLSCPVRSQNILNGEFAPLLANFSSTPSTCFDFYKFNSACDPLHWINLRNTDLSVNTNDFGQPPHFDVKRGYLVAYNGCLPLAKIFTGTPNTGDQTYTLTVGLPSCNWDLLGNPFPSAFKWNEVLNKSNLATGYYYVWNENKDGGPGYEAFLDDSHCTGGVNGNIPAMQGFFVKVGVSGSTITVLNSARIHDGNYWLKNAKDSSPNKLKLTFSNSLNFDDTYVMFESKGSIGIDWYDAEKIFSMDDKIPQIYTLVDNDQKTLFNEMPYINGPATIPIGILAPENGNYSIKVSGIESFNPLSGLTLEDLKMNTSQDMVLNPVYRFTASGNEDAKRFLLHFAGPISIADQKEIAPIKIYSVSKTVYISCASGMHNGQVNVTNCLGQQILTKNLDNQLLNQVQLNVVEGYYIVKLQTDVTVKTAKVYIK